MSYKIRLWVCSYAYFLFLWIIEDSVSFPIGCQDITYELYYILTKHTAYTSGVYKTTLDFFVVGTTAHCLCIIPNACRLQCYISHPLTHSQPPPLPRQTTAMLAIHCVGGFTALWLQILCRYQ